MTSNEDDLIKNIWGRIEPERSSNVSIEVMNQLKQAQKRRWTYQFLGVVSTWFLCLWVVLWGDLSLYKGINETFSFVHLSFFKLKMFVAHLFF